MIYHIVCPVKYRRKAFTVDVEKTLKDVCLEIQERYEFHFVEIWADIDHVHFLVQSVPMMLVKNIVQTTKSITAKEIFKKNPEIKKLLWWWHFWTSWYYVNTVWQHWNESVIAEYVKNQWKEYKKLHRGQLTLFES